LTTISEFDGIQIRMKFSENEPPHFYVWYDEDEVAVAIDSLMVIKSGSISRKALGKAIDWAGKHKAQLMADWELCRAGKGPEKIAA
jgi:ABC-type Fe3+ transport system substrate-binding protein